LADESGLRAFAGARCAQQNEFHRSPRNVEILSGAGAFFEGEKQAAIAQYPLKDSTHVLIFYLRRPTMSAVLAIVKLSCSDLTAHSDSA
jgi:hypothetical protein